MKMKIFGLVLLNFLLLAACRPGEEEEGNLLISVGPQDQYVLPVAMRTCKEQRENDDTYGIAKPSLNLSRFSWQWLGDNRLEIVYIKIEFESPDLSSGKYSCYLSDKDLAETLYPHLPLISGDASRPVRTSQCGLRCGGIDIKEDVQFTYMTGEVTVYGVEITADEEYIPVTANADISVQYKKD